MTIHKDPFVSLVGDEMRATLLRLFVTDAGTAHTPKEIAKALKRPLKKAKDTLRQLEKDTIIRKQKLSSAEQKKRNTKEKDGYTLNKRYKHIEFLNSIITDTIPNEREMVVNKINRVPGVSLILTTGIFQNKDERGIDMLIASTEEENLVLNQVIRDIEKVIGRELCCTVMTVNDMAFRLQIKDRFLMDILTDEHTLHLDRTGLFAK